MSDTPPDTGTDAPPPEPAATADPPDLSAEVEKWKAQARKWEDRAKANSAAAKDLDTLRQQTESDLEKAVRLAREEAARETATQFGTRLVDAELKAALSGRDEDVVKALLENLDRSRFLTPDGEPDSDAIKAWVGRIAPQPETPALPGQVDLGQGSRGTPAHALNGDPLLRDLKAKLGVS